MLGSVNLLIRRRVYCARFFVLLLLGLFFAVSQSGAAIQGFSIVSTLPSLSDITAQRIMGSNIHLNLSIQADQGSYRMLAFRNSVLNEVVAQNNEFEHPGGTGSYYLRVPLLEGSNTFFLKLIDLSGKSAEATTATAFIIERDLEFTATEIRLNHIESSSAGVSLYTSDRRVNVFYTINGNAASYEVKFLVNLLTADTVVVPGPGNYSRNSILLTTDSLNTVQLEVRSLDPNGQPLGKQAESNPMRIFQDRTSPTIVDLTTTFQNTTPPAGTPFGPTDLASFGVNIGTDTPFARVSILNETTGDEVTRIAGQNGRITISGIELPKDPSLGDLGITTTAYTALAFDEAGNLSQARQFRVERIAIEPCFNLLRMDPFDGGRIGNGQALTVLGAVCDRNSPHRVVFKIASPTEFSANGFLQEEQIRNLGGGELFDKDISLAINPTAPNEDVTYSIQAQVITTNPLDPTKEEFSKDHDLGVVILDRKPPAPPTVLTARTIFATNSPSFTIDGETEREARIEFSAPGTFSFKPSRTVPAITNEFRSVVDISAAQDGLYDVVLTARDIAGNSGVNSNGKILIKVDRRRPRVKSVAVNDNLIELTRPFFLRPTQNARIRVLVDEPMPVAPRVYVTQQGDFGIEAGLSQVVGDLEFEYQFVVRQSIDGNKDGPVEILVVGGRDDSGNAIVEHREPQAFVVDTLAPGLDRALTKPQDGSIVGKVPSPLRLILREHPKTRVPGSGPFPEMTKIRAFGPIETNPTRVVTGRTEVFDPRSVDFYPSAEEMNLDGTYLFEVTLQDRAGNQFIETLVLELDLEKLSTTLILERFPAPGSFFNPLTLPRLDNLPFASIGVEPLLTPEMNLAATQFEAFNYLRSPQKLPLSLPEVVGTTTIRVKFGRDFTVDGRDDGVITLISRILDTAGNVSEDSVYSWVYDSLAPGVMDGLSFPVPEGFSTGDLRDPPQGALRSGPLKTISSILFDRKTPLGFLGSGLDTSIASTSALTSSTIVLHLDQSFGSVQAGAIVTGRIKFRSDLTQSAPVFGGPAVTRMLFELNVDPITLEPLGLPDDGSMDGVYRMQVQAVDMAQNQSPWSTSWFLYDT
ncbi:MAG: hypothetical protein H3C47_13780, partial [Candidatus Cloacimonetes bacterium]|nr:hypothetical protein [Candidatus Cloacimonadota bacterium]